MATTPATAQFQHDLKCHPNISSSFNLTLVKIRYIKNIDILFSTSIYRITLYRRKNIKFFDIS